MVKRELIRISACSMVGLIVGIIMAFNNNAWYYAVLVPFYGVGTFYGIKLILAALGGIGKAAGKSLFMSIAIGQWIGLLIVIILLVITAVIVLTFGWIIGIFIAGKALFDAFGTDSEISCASSGSNNTSWDSDNNSSSGKSKKSKNTSNNDNDNNTW